MRWCSRVSECSVFCDFAAVDAIMHLRETKISHLSEKSLLLKHVLDLKFNLSLKNRREKNSWVGDITITFDTRDSQTRLERAERVLNYFEISQLFRTNSQSEHVDKLEWESTEDYWESSWEVKFLQSDGLQAGDISHDQFYAYFLKLIYSLRRSN